ncbi:MAG TPA: oxidoreductase [Acidimicrobiia bacterium]|nr:oxidoreductase [Acidimicrobiia bacterium]
MEWTIGRIPDQRGKLAVVTGGNGGLGLETVRALADAGASVIMAARNQAKAVAARQEILQAEPDGSVSVAELDLASLGSIGRFVDGFELPRLDVLINNAGVMGTPERTTDDGFELQIGTNHLGHFALTAGLMPALLGAKNGRVVSVSSFARLYRGRGWKRGVGPYDTWREYGRSKMANLLFARELDRRLRSTPATLQSLAAHPGFTHTDLQARSVREAGGLSQKFFHAAVQRFGMTPREGVASILRAATDPQAVGGEFYGPRWFTFGEPARKRFTLGHESEARRLWDVSEEMTGVAFDVAVLVEAGGD